MVRGERREEECKVLSWVIVAGASAAMCWLSLKFDYALLWVLQMVVCAQGLMQAVHS
jgi:hypothetical protein